MRKKPISVLVGLASIGALQSAPISAAEPLSLSPSSAWNAHYAEDSCMLIRAFGKDETKVLMRLEQTAPSSRFSMTLVGKPVRATGPFVRASFTFLPGGERNVRDRTAAGEALDSKLPILIAESIDLLGDREGAADAPYDWKKAAEVESLLIERGGRKILLNLGKMQGPIKAMQACTDELLTHWGLDAAAQRTLQRLPKPRTNPQSWLDWDDYPSAALESGRSAIVRFRLTVDANGLVSRCAIPSATTGPEFAKVTCRAISRRARFDPALDKDGKPIASYYVSTVTWVAS